MLPLWMNREGSDETVQSFRIHNINVLFITMRLVFVARETISQMVIALFSSPTRLEGEIIVYPWSGVCPSSIGVHNFKHEYLCNQWADHNEIFIRSIIGMREMLL